MKLVFVRGYPESSELSGGIVDIVANPIYDLGHPLVGVRITALSRDGRSPREKVEIAYLPLADPGSNLPSSSCGSSNEKAKRDREDAFKRQIEHAYYEILIAFGLTTDASKRRLSLGMPLLSMKGDQWEIAASLNCLLRACMRYAGEHGSLTCGLGMVRELRVYCLDSIWPLAKACQNRRCIAFMDGPLAWDEIGDAKLWHLLMNHFYSTQFDSMGPLDVLIECQRETIRLTGAPLDGANCQRFLSKLELNPTIYEASPAVAQLGLPILISNMVNLNMGVHDGNKPRFIINTELVRGDDKPSYSLRLPHDMISLLEGLRGQVQDYTTRTRTYLDPREKVSLTSYRLHGSRFIVRYTLEIAGSYNERYDFDFRCAQSLCEALACKSAEFNSKLRDYGFKHGTRALIGLVESCMQKWEVDSLYPAHGLT